MIHAPSSLQLVLRIFNKQNMHDVMIANDQLSTEMTHPSSVRFGSVKLQVARYREVGHVRSPASITLRFISQTFQGFVEGPLHFRPTYKFDKFSDAYDSSQKQVRLLGGSRVMQRGKQYLKPRLPSPPQRVPSWTDRILFHQSGLQVGEICHLKSHQRVSHVLKHGCTCSFLSQLTAYNAAIGLRSSDHRPVYASFVLEVKGAKGILERVDAYASHHHFGATTSEVCSIQ
jgi:hypothetical protein